MTTQEKITKKMYEALMSKYSAEMSEAEATLLIYLNNPVGIGEHPQHLEEMDKIIKKREDDIEALEQQLFATKEHVEKLRGRK